MTTNGPKGSIHKIVTAAGALSLAALMALSAPARHAEAMQGLVLPSAGISYVLSSRSITLGEYAAVSRSIQSGPVKEPAKVEETRLTPAQQEGRAAIDEAMRREVEQIIAQAPAQEPAAEEPANATPAQSAASTENDAADLMVPSEPIPGFVAPTAAEVTPAETTAPSGTSASQAEASSTGNAPAAAENASTGTILPASPVAASLIGIPAAQTRQTEAAPAETPAPAPAEPALNSTPATSVAEIDLITEAEANGANLSGTYTMPESIPVFNVTDETDEDLAYELEADAASRSAQEAAGAVNITNETQQAAANETYDASLVVAKVADYINIRKEPSTDAEVLGRLYGGSSAKLLGPMNEDGWVEILSGNVRGYVLKDYLTVGATAQGLAEQNSRMVAVVTTQTLRVRAAADIESDVITLVPEGDKLNIISEEDGWLLVETPDGDGYISADFADIEKEYRFAETSEEAEKKSYEARAAEEASRKATEAKIKAAAAQKAADEAVAAAEAAMDDLRLAEEAAEAQDLAEEKRKEAQAAVEEAQQLADLAEETARRAAEEAEAQRRAAEQAASEARAAARAAEKAGQAFSTAEGSSKGQEVARYALQFVGNPYVWGGTSLTNGVDCSGFTMQVYAHFGVSLPHYDASQRTKGTAVPSLAAALPGDLVCYDGHVGIYIGNGQIVHASNPRSGIKVSNATYRSILAIRRIFN